MASSLRHQFRTDEEGQEQPPDLGLPTELWLLIISYIDGRNELFTLSRTSQWLRELIQGRLYGHLAITTPLDQRPGSFIKLDKTRRNLLLRTLLSPRIANLVTTFQVRLPGCDRYDSIWPKLPFGDRCGCSNLDNRLGNALRTLPNIQALEIRCFFCEDTADTRHLHLATLAATNLQELLLSCQCSRSGKKSQAILSSPCLDSVTRLHWVMTGGRIDSTVRISPQQTREILPLLNKLSYDYDAIFDEIVSRRRITHLGCQSMNTNLHQAIRTNEGHLVHIRVGGEFLKLINFLTSDSQPYRNVRHVGCFHFELYKGDEILRYMLAFTALEQLGSIEVSTQTVRYRNRISIEPIGSEVWNDAFLFGLQKQHPKLKRVFLKVRQSMNKLTGETCDFFVWERDRTWKEHTIAPFTRSDMEIGLEPRILL